MPFPVRGAIDVEHLAQRRLSAIHYVRCVRVAAFIALAIAIAAMLVVTFQRHDTSSEWANVKGYRASRYAFGTTMRPHYRVSDLGHADVPVPRGARASWLLRILRTPYWAMRSGGLWFVPDSFENVPLVVYYCAWDWCADGGAHQIIGARCGAWVQIDTISDFEFPLPAPGGENPSIGADPLSPDHRRDTPLPPPTLTPVPPEIARLLERAAP